MWRAVTFTLYIEVLLETSILNPSLSIFESFMLQYHRLNSESLFTWRPHAVEHWWLSHQTVLSQLLLSYNLQWIAGNSDIVCVSDSRSLFGFTNKRIKEIYPFTQCSFHFKQVVLLISGPLGWCGRNSYQNRLPFYILPILSITSGNKAIISWINKVPFTPLTRVEIVPIVLKTKVHIGSSCCSSLHWPCLTNCTLSPLFALGTPLFQGFSCGKRGGRGRGEWKLECHSTAPSILETWPWKLTWELRYPKSRCGSNSPQRYQNLKDETMEILV